MAVFCKNRVTYGHFPIGNWSWKKSVPVKIYPFIACFEWHCKMKLGQTDGGTEKGQKDKKDFYHNFSKIATAQTNSFLYKKEILIELRTKPEGKYVNWPKVDLFKQFGGIRIEDNICMTTTGPENWTREEFARQMKK